jgi:hypothetical protein
LLIICVHRDILWAAGASASSSCTSSSNTLVYCSRLRRLLRLLVLQLAVLLLLLQQQHLRLLVCHYQQPPLRQREQHGPHPAAVAADAADAAGDVHFKHLFSASDADAVVVAEGLVSGRPSEQCGPPHCVIPVYQADSKLQKTPTGSVHQQLMCQCSCWTAGAP